MATSTTLAGITQVAPVAPSAVAGSTTGALNTSAVYGYKVTYVTAFGETEPSPAGTQTTTSSASLTVTIPVANNNNVIARKIYRTVGGGSTYLLLATIGDNITTVYTDLIADASLGAAAPTSNFAYARETVVGLFKTSQPQAYSTTVGITAASGGGQSAATALTSEYNFVSTVAVAADSVRLPELNVNLVGIRVVVANDGANSVNIFPTLGQDASGGTNTAVALAASGRASFVAKTATAWGRVQ